MIEEVNRQWEEFERLGEVEVRQRLANQIYGEPKISQAKAWLTHIQNQRLEEFNNESLSLANKIASAANLTANAALLQAKAAKSMDKTAKIMLIIGIISAILSLMGILHSYEVL